MNKKILIFGSQGQLGAELIRLIDRESWEITTYNRNQVDLLDLKAIHHAIQIVRPDVIVNCAAYTAVDRAESEPELAMKINRDAPKIMAIAAQEINSYLIHISTDYVFDGRHYMPYKEQDLTNPTSIYGKSKLAGETEIIKDCENHIILRTAWVYGCYGKGNFVKTMLRLASERQELNVVCDQIGTPTWTKDLAKTIIQLLPNLTTKNSGIYHYTNSGACSWYDFATAALAEAALLNLSIQAKHINPIPTAAYPTPAQRPHYSVLSCEKISDLLGQHPPHWQASLKKMITEYIQSPESQKYLS